MRELRLEAVIPAPRPQVWSAWTSTEGARTFFAPEANIELRPLGPYELLFDREQPPGRQGTEGLRVLSFVPEEMLSVEWNAPPEFGELRDVRTWVVVQFAEAGEGRTQVRLRHFGWGSGEEWDQVYAYFTRAWGLVLHWLAHRFEHGPIDWSNPPMPGGTR